MSEQPPGLAEDLSAVSGLVVGVGCRPGTAGETIVHAVREIVGDSGVRCLATVDRRARELGFQHAAHELRTSTAAFSPAELAEVEVPNPARRTAAALGTAGVAEAAALLACVNCYGTGHLVITKRVIGQVTIAVARPGPA
jgi:cobalt-precorrin 5A hydrolase